MLRPRVDKEKRTPLGVRFLESNKLSKRFDHSVGESRLWRVYARLPLTSELDALCAAYANPLRLALCARAGFDGVRVTKRKTTQSELD